MKPVRVERKVHCPLGTYRPLSGRIPAHENLVIPQPQLTTPVVTAFFDAYVNETVALLAARALHPDGTTEARSKWGQVLRSHGPPARPG